MQDPAERRPLPRLYTELAPYWQLVSAPEDYANEAHFWRNALRKRLGPGRHEVLELGVGGGNNLSHLAGDFAFTAVDASPAMLAEARRLNPEVTFHVGDMRTVRLERTFDAVLIHDAISYMQTEQDLRATFATARAHLRPGGVLITAPDWIRETFRPPYASAHTKVFDGVEFSSFDCTFDPDPQDTTYESLMWYVIRQPGEPPRIEHDHHRFGLFPLATWQALIGEAGFRFERDPYPVHEDGREGSLFVGVRENPGSPSA